VGEYGIPVKDHNPEFKDEEVLKGGEHPGLDPDANVGAWVKAIKKLDSATVYKKYSNLARERSRQLNSADDLKKLETFLYGHLQRSRELHAN